MRVLFLSLVCFFVVGCESQTLVNPGPPDTNASTPDSSSSDVSQQDTVADTANQDALTSDSVSTDLAGEDTAQTTACEPGEGCFGESCADADDCLSGVCTMHMGDKVCSKPCTTSCPEGFACTLTGSGTNSQYMCISNFTLKQ